MKIMPALRRGLAAQKNKFLSQDCSAPNRGHLGTLSLLSWSLLCVCSQTIQMFQVRFNLQVWLGFQGAELRIEFRNQGSRQARGPSDLRGTIAEPSPVFRQKNDFLSHACSRNFRGRSHAMKSQLLHKLVARTFTLTPSYGLKPCADLGNFKVALYDMVIIVATCGGRAGNES